MCSLSKSGHAFQQSRDVGVGIARSRGACVFPLHRCLQTACSNICHRDTWESWWCCLLSKLHIRVTKPNVDCPRTICLCLVRGLLLCIPGHFLPGLPMGESRPASAILATNTHKLARFPSREGVQRLPSAPALLLSCVHILPNLRRPSTQQLVEIETLSQVPELHG